MTENEPHMPGSPIDPTSTEAKAAEARKIAEAYIQSAMAKKAATEAAVAQDALAEKAAAEAAMAESAAVAANEAQVAADEAAKEALQAEVAVSLEATPVATADEQFGAVLEAESLPPNQPVVPNAAAVAAGPPMTAAPAPAAPMAAAPVAATPEEPKKKRGGKIALIVILIICLMAALTAAAVLFLRGADDAPAPVAEDTELPRLSDAQVITAFDAASMEAPDISQYAYVAQDALIGPQFSDIVLNEPVNASGNQPIECTATASATFKNKGIEIVVPVTLLFTYDPVSAAWVPGDLTRGEATATPLASPSATEILANLNTILSAYDPTYAEQMADADITKTNANLTIDGGIIGLDLSKTVTTEADGVRRTTLSTSSVTLGVAWSPTEGWIVSVNNAGEIASTPTETIADNADEAVNQPDAATAAVQPAPQPEQEPDKVGGANYGDSLVLAGTLERIDNAANLAKNNDYSNADASETANGSVQFAFVLKRPLEITLNGTTYRLTSVAIATSGLSNSELGGLYGKAATVSGTIDQSFGTSWTPVGLKTTEIRDVAL